MKINSVQFNKFLIFIYSIAPGRYSKSSNGDDLLPPMNRISIALVNRHPILMNGLFRIFASNKAFQVVAKGEAPSDILNIVSTHNPALLVLDLDDSKEIFKIISAVSRISKTTKVIVFTPDSNVERAIMAFDAGAAAYVLTSSTAGELMDAIRAALRGDRFISPSMATKLVTALQMAARRKAAVRSKRLSAREEQIIGHLLKGKTNKEIAISLGLSEKTIKHYMTLLMQKLDARNRLELALAVKTFEPAFMAPHPSSYKLDNGSYSKPAF